MSYENSAFVSAEDDGVVYEIEYDDRVEVRNVLSHAPSLRTSFFLGWLEGEDWDVDVNPLQTDEANANARNAIRNYDGVGSDT